MGEGCKMVNIRLSTITVPKEPGPTLKKLPFDVKFIALLLISFVIGLVVGYAIFSPGLGGGAAPTPEKTVYNIGFTLPLSGELSSIGKIWEKVVQIAIEDLNSEAAAYGFNVEFRSVILDDATSDEKALQNVQSLYQQGIKVIIGPAASSQVKVVKSYADNNKIVIISPSSTSPTLAIPNDYIFRTVGSDAGQAKALSTLAYQEGARKLIVFFRNDEYGKAFADFLEQNFKEKGITVSKLPYQTGLSDYASEVATLASRVGSEGADSVILIAFDTDGANIISHAAESDVLSNVRWFISEGPHGAGELLTSTVGRFASRVRLYGTRPLYIGNPLYEDLFKRVKSRFGIELGVFCEHLYDAIKLAGWAILRAGEYDGEAIRNALVEVAKTYYGPSGWTMFDVAGDKAQQDYGVWAIVSTAEGYKFKDVGVFERGSIIFTEQAYP
ncbi:MAG: ABC transporter substrate-binding protein [Thermoproteota archaeon]